MLTYLRTRRPLWWSVVGAVLATILLHALLLTTPLQSDEGGYAVVAQHANQPGPYIYGHLFVDRPPLLIEIFRLADVFGLYGSRVIAIVAAVVIVLASVRAAFLLAGPVAAIWAGWLSAALGSSSLLAAEQLNGEILAGAFVAVGIVGFLESLHRASSQRWLALGLGVVSGAASLGALLVKQNFADALAFAGIYSVVLLCRRRRPVFLLWLGYTVGLVAVALWTLSWTRNHHGLGALFYAMYGIRAQASGALASVGVSSEVRSVGIFLAAGIGSGLLVLAVALIGLHWRQALRLTPVRLGYAAAVLVELVGIFGGGNFAPHYLLGLVPTLSVIAAVLIASTPAPQTGRRLRGALLRWASALILVSTLVASPTMAVTNRLGTNPDEAIASWLKKSASPGDTLVVPFTNAQVLRLSGLTPGYPYLWALLVRTRDPHLTLFLRTLDGAAPPTWIVRWDSPSDLDLQPSGSIDEALQRRYRLQGELCGHQIWLLKGHTARAALPTRCD